MPYFKPLCIPFLILVPQLSNRGCYCTSHIFSNSRFGHLFCLNYSFPLNGVRSSHACMIRIMLLLYGEDIPSNTHTDIMQSTAICMCISSISLWYIIANETTFRSVFERQNSRFLSENLTSTPQGRGYCLALSLLSIIIASHYLCLALALLSISVA